MNIIDRNNVKVFGKGTQPMMFAHGFGCDQTMWRYITAAFEEHYKIVLFDYVGCGKSDMSCYDPADYSSLEGYAQDVIDICHALQLRDVILVGHSVSGMIGAMAARQEPHRFSRIIMLGPSACYINDVNYKGGLERNMVEGIIASIESGSGEWPHQLGPVVMGNPDRPELADELISLFCNVAPEVARQFARATFLTDSRASLSGLNVPTLILQCTNDIVAPEEAGAFIHKHVPDSTFIKMKATGHVPQVSAPEETVQIMKSYLGGI